MAHVFERTFIYICSTLKNMNTKFVCSILLLSFLFFQLGHCQLLDAVWQLGYNNSPAPYAEGIQLDFKLGAPQITNFSRKMPFFRANSGICDSSGNILFYSNGFWIADATHDTMIGGSGLNPGQFANVLSNFGNGIPQSSIILPLPDNTNLFYLFHETIDYNPGPYQVLRLFKTVVDMSLNNGLGAVISKNDTLIEDTLLFGELTAVKHGNGRDWWLLTHRWQSDEYYSFLIDPQGIHGPYSQHIGAVCDNGISGQACFSPDGTKYAHANLEVDLEIFDFDRCTGLLSNPVQIFYNDSFPPYSVAFSSNSKYLYVSTFYEIHQYDVGTSNIAATDTVVAIYDGFYDQWPQYQSVFYLAQLAPDNKIYLTCANGVRYLHVINNPDSQGIACDVQQHSLYLGDWASACVPNYPNFKLGALGGSACDTLGVVENVLSIGEIEVYPNPASDFITIKSAEKNITYTQIVDVTGRIYSLPMDAYGRIDIVNLSEGLYFITAYDSRNKILGRKKFVYTHR